MEVGWGAKIGLVLGPVAVRGEVVNGVGVSNSMGPLCLAAPLLVVLEGEGKKEARHRIRKQLQADCLRTLREDAAEAVIAIVLEGLVEVLRGIKDSLVCC